MRETYDAKPEHSLDYRFGWRWLLQLRKSTVLDTRSLRGAEKQWWQHRFATCNETGEPEGLLLGLNDALPNEQLDRVLSQNSLRWIAAWGIGENVRALAGRLHAFSSVRCYALLPPHMPRIVVPLSSPAAALAGLRLHQPGGWLARLALAAVTISVRLGCYRPLQRNMLLIANRDCSEQPSDLQQIVDAGNHSSIDAALYLGNPEPNRKTIALPLVAGHAAGCIVKSADSPTGCEALRNEATALICMADTVLHSQVPTLIYLRDELTQVSLVQTYRVRQAVLFARHKQAVQAFLCKLSTVDTSYSTLASQLENLTTEVPEQISALTQMLYDLPAQTELLLHRSHGDFAPWNCSWTTQGLFVYDWEASTAGALALSDAFHYVLAPLRLIKQSDNGTNALKMIMQFTAPLLPAMGLHASHIPRYLALWLLRQRNHPALHLNLARTLLNYDD